MDRWLVRCEFAVDIEDDGSARMVKRAQAEARVKLTTTTSFIKCKHRRAFPTPETCLALTLSAHSLLPDRTTSIRRNGFNATVRITMRGVHHDLISALLLTLPSTVAHNTTTHSALREENPSKLVLEQLDARRSFLVRRVGKSNPFHRCPRSTKVLEKRRASLGPAFDCLGGESAK